MGWFDKNESNVKEIEHVRGRKFVPTGPENWRGNPAGTIRLIQLYPRSATKTGKLAGGRRTGYFPGTFP